MSSFRRVVVTGIGAITPLGNTAPEYWEGLRNGVSGTASITRFDASKFKTRFAAEVKGYNPDNFFDRKEHRKMDLFTQFGVVAADEAIADAGLLTGGVNKDRVGVIWGSGIGGLKSLQEECFAFGRGDGTPRYSPFFIPRMIADSSSGNISIKNGFRGPNFVTTSACASSSDSIISAFNTIRLGLADVVVTGGSEAAITELPKLLAPLLAGTHDVAFGSRALDRNLIGVHQSWLRERSGRFFNHVMRRVIGLPFADTQCGFKGFRLRVMRPLVEGAVLDRFGFDVELLYLAYRAGLRMLELPVVWNDAAGSKVSMLGGLHGFRELRQLQRRARRGFYRAAIEQARAVQAGAGGPQVAS